MKHYGTPARTGDVIEVRGSGNAPGAGGVISTVVVTDKGANGRTPDKGGYSCRDATLAEVKTARESGRFRTEYC